MIGIIINFLFCSNIIYFCSVKLDCSISYKESGFKIITINWNIAISCIYEWIKCCPNRNNIDEWLILLKNTILLMKSQLVTSYTLKHDVNRCFWNPAWSKCKHVYKPVGSFINNRVCQYVNTTDPGADPGRGAPGALPTKIGKNKIFWRNIVIIHTKYPKNFRASLRSAQFCLSAPPPTWYPESAPVILLLLSIILQLNNSYD